MLFYKRVELDEINVKEVQQSGDTRFTASDEDAGIPSQRLKMALMSQLKYFRVPIDGFRIAPPVAPPVDSERLSDVVVVDDQSELLTPSNTLVSITPAVSDGDLRVLSERIVPELSLVKFKEVCLHSAQVVFLQYS